MSQNNAAILAKLAELEIAAAAIRAMLSGETPMPSTPTKAASAVVPGAPVKAGAMPLTDEDLNAMLKAGVKAGAQVKALGKTVFKAIGLPEHLHSAAREQWKEWRKEVSDEDAALAEQEIVLGEEILDALKDTQDSKGKTFNAKTRTSAMASEFATYDIHPILHDKAGKEFRQWAEENGFGERMKAPTPPKRERKVKEALPALLTADMLLALREEQDDKGKPFHSGSQVRKMADALTGLGISAEDHKRAVKEWKVYASAEGITSKTASKAGSKAGSEASSRAVSEGIPEEVGTGPVLAIRRGEEAEPVAAAAAAAPKPKPKPKRKRATKSILSLADCAKVSELLISEAEPTDEALTKVLSGMGIKPAVMKKAREEWREWAKENHKAETEETEDEEGETEETEDEEDDEMDLGDYEE